MNSIYKAGYEKLETLYENNTTIVYRAINKQGETYLLKAIKNNLVSEEQLSRLEYEYKILKELNCPDIVKVLDFIKNEKNYIIVMEDTKGIPLSEVQEFKNIRNGVLSLKAYNIRSILEIFINMSEILGKLHDKDIIHQDINPENFLILPNTLKLGLLDFGFAAKVDMISNENLNIKMLERRLSYISPEQTGRIDRNPDFRTDFYSLGVSMYELLTGRKPFSSGDPIELVHSIIAKTPISPVNINPSIPGAISDIIMKLLEKDPDIRFNSAAGIINDLGRCLEELNTSGKVENFELGVHDISSKFIIQHKLYGRDNERKIIGNIYAQAAGGASRLLLVGGYAGIGKTTVIQEIYRPLVDNESFFASGKAEQFQENTPYFVIIQIIKELVLMLLQKSDTELERWKARFEKELSTNGRLITDLVPEFEYLIGKQPEVEELGLAESRNRYLNTLGNFFKIFAQENHPLCILLDDLQWCDQSSMEFIRYIHMRDDIEGLLVIGSYRNNELKEGHQLYSLLKELQQAVNTESLNIEPLEEKYVSEIISDVLHCSADKVTSLTGYIYKKTKGNPFFIKNILIHLYNMQLIRFNKEIMLWVWDIKEIESIDISENIVDFIISQISILPEATQDILGKAAMIGSSFNLWILSDISGIPVSEVVVRLQEAVNGDIVVPDNKKYDMPVKMKKTENNLNFRFTHDRLQQACAALLKEEQQKQLHLQIGRYLRSNTPESLLEERAMEILRHINKSLDEIITFEERWDIASLNFIACRRARAAAAFQPAFQYIKDSVSLLPENSWELDYKLSLSVYKAFMECAYLNSEYTLADEQAKLLIKHAKSTEEQAEIRLMQATLYSFLGDLEKVLDSATLGLKLLGFHTSTDPSLFDVGIEFIKVKAALLRKDSEDLYNLPPMYDSKKQLIFRLLNEMCKVSYVIGRINLFFTVTLKSVLLTLKYGHSPEAASVYSGYTVMLAIFGDLKGAEKFGKLSIRLCEEEERAKWRGSIYNAYGFFGHGWSSSWCDMNQWFERGFEDSMRYGDYYSMVLAGTFMYAFKPDENLKSLVQKSMKQVPIVKQTDNKFGYYMLFILINRYLNYAGLTDGLFTMDLSIESYEQNDSIGIVSSEAECIENMRQVDSQSLIGIYYKEKMFIHYLYDDYKGAMNYLKESDKYMKYHTGNPYMVECRFCSFLVTAANMPDMGGKENGKALRRLKKEYKHMKGWAKHNPANFEHLKYLMEAEFARIEQKPYKAAELYDLAILNARKNGFIRDEALANELAAKMFLEFNKEKQVAYYMIEAYKGYQFWGAEAKTRHMKDKYGYLLQFNDTTEKDSVFESVDMMSIIKTSQSVAKEADINNLLKEVMKTIVENSGAEKAFILFKTEQDWRIEAEYLPEESKVKVLQAIAYEEAGSLLSTSVVNFCIHSGENIVLSDASFKGNFQKDPYIERNQIRSLLCMPIRNQGDLAGIIYLENNLSADVFTSERIQVLQLLSTQYFVTIKNAKLFSDLLVTMEKLYQSNEEVLRSEIAFLQAQIKPHFLFNAINTIAAFSLDDPNMTRDLLANLSQYLRASFDFKNRDKLVTLERELELVEAYLFIEKARFGERLRIVYDIDDNIDCMLPPLVIQPLVENATQHGLSDRKYGGTVKITVKDTDSFVTISVEDDGAGMEEEKFTELLEGNTVEKKGVALKNINLRLTRMYGQGLKMEKVVTGGTRIIMTIPK